MRGRTKVFDFFVSGKFVTRGSYSQIAKQQKRTVSWVRNVISTKGHIYSMMYVGNLVTGYRVYKDGKLIAEGSRAQIEKELGVREHMLFDWKSGRIEGYRVEELNHLVFEPLPSEELEHKREARRQKRLEANKPPIKPKPARPKMVITKVKLKEFRFTDPWINYQLDGMFRNW